MVEAFVFERAEETLRETFMPMAANRRTMPGAPTRGFSRAMRSTASTVSVGSADCPRGLAKHAVLYQQEAQATILSAVEPRSTGEYEDGEVIGHGVTYG